MSDNALLNANEAKTIAKALIAFACATENDRERANRDDEDDEDGAMFFELALGAARAVCAVIAKAPKAMALKAIEQKVRVVKASDRESAIGCGLMKADEEAFARACGEGARRRRSLIVSVNVPCGMSVVMFGANVDGEVVVDSHAIEHAAPSIWALAPKTATSDDERWLYCVNKGNGRTKTLPEFAWTGNLRPGKISHSDGFRGLRAVPDGVKRTDYAETSRPTSEETSRLQRLCKELTASEKEEMRKCCIVARGAIDAVVRAIRPGVVPDELDRICHDYITAHGGYPSPLNYYSFPKSCCISVNEVICHGIPDSRPLEKGDIVNIDVTAYIYGYHGDLNETVLVGKPEDVDEKSKHLLKVALECLWLAIDNVKPGNRYRDLGDIISTHAAKNNCSVVKTYCGHGINELFHCAPSVPHYGNNKAEHKMKPGHSFTIEPMINLGEWRDVTWPDGWTAVTRDGSRSAQYEHTMVVTEDGVDVLTARLPTSPRVFPFFDDSRETIDYLTGRLAAL